VSQFDSDGSCWHQRRDGRMATWFGSVIRTDGALGRGATCLGLSSTWVSRPRAGIASALAVIIIGTTSTTRIAGATTAPWFDLAGSGMNRPRDHDQAQAPSRSQPARVFLVPTGRNVDGDVGRGRATSTPSPTRIRGGRSRGSGHSIASACADGRTEPRTPGWRARPRERGGVTRVTGLESEGAHTTMLPAEPQARGARCGVRGGRGA
jgi:hypothetical protein